MRIQDILTGIDPIIYCQSAKTGAYKTLLKTKFITVAMIMAACLTLIPLSIELALTFTIIDMNFGADLPDDPTPIKVYILSFATISAIIAFHVLMLNDGEHPLAQLLRKISRVMVFFYFIGMFLLFSTTETGNLMDGDLSGILSGLGSEESVADSSGEMLNNIIAVIKPYLGLVSSLALGGLVFVNLAVVDALISFIKDNLLDVIEKKKTANSILKKITEFSQLTDDLIGMVGKRVALETIPEKVHASKAAAMCEAAMKPTLRVLKKIHFLKTNEVANDDIILERHGSLLPDLMPSAKELKTFIESLEALIAKLPQIIKKHK